MAQEKNTQPEKPETAPVEKTRHFVTSDHTIDFPALDWAIRAGETRELPADESARKVILSHHLIKEIKN